MEQLSQLSVKGTTCFPSVIMVTQRSYPSTDDWPMTDTDGSRETPHPSSVMDDGWYHPRMVLGKWACHPLDGQTATEPHKRIGLLCMVRRLPP